MASQTKTAARHEPLAIVEEGLGTVSSSIQDGLREVQNAWARWTPKVTRLAARTVYSTFYAASFGVTYSAIVFEEVVPLNNPMGDGLKDGAKAARTSRTRRVAGHKAGKPAKA